MFNLQTGWSVEALTEGLGAWNVVHARAGSIGAGAAAATAVDLDGAPRNRSGIAPRDRHWPTHARSCRDAHQALCAVLPLRSKIRPQHRTLTQLASGSRQARLSSTNGVYPTMLQSSKGTARWCVLADVDTNGDQTSWSTSNFTADDDDDDDGWSVAPVAGDGAEDDSWGVAVAEEEVDKVEDPDDLDARAPHPPSHNMNVIMYSAARFARFVAVMHVSHSARQQTRRKGLSSEKVFRPRLACGQHCDFTSVLRRHQLSPIPNPAPLRRRTTACGWRRSPRSALC